MYSARRIEEGILLLKIRHGDQAAFATLYDRYVDALFRFISFRVRQPETAQDITSDLFLRVWEYLRKPEGKQVLNLRAYLYQVARNLIADHYRATQGQGELPLEEAFEVKAESGRSSEHLERQVTLKEVEQALALLKPEWQEVIVLAHVEGLRASEIASIIGKSTAATRVTLHRALQELKRLLSQT